MSFPKSWEDAAQINAHKYIASTTYQNECYYNAHSISNLYNPVNILIGEFGEGIQDKVLLELGCGNGRQTRYLSDIFKEVIAVDFSPTMIKQCQNRCQNKNIKYITNNGLDIKVVPNNSVDAVYTFIVLQHCTQNVVKGYIKEVNRVLKKDGIFVFQLPIYDKHYEPIHFGDVANWTETELMNELLYFKVLRIDKYHFGFHVAKKI